MLYYVNRENAQCIPDGVCTVMVNKLKHVPLVLSHCCDIIIRDKGIIRGGNTCEWYSRDISELSTLLAMCPRVKKLKVTAYTDNSSATFAHDPMQITRLCHCAGTQVTDYHAESLTYLKAARLPSYVHFPRLRVLHFTGHPNMLPLPGYVPALRHAFIDGGVPVEPHTYDPMRNRIQESKHTALFELCMKNRIADVLEVVFRMHDVPKDVFDMFVRDYLSVPQRWKGTDGVIRFLVWDDVLRTLMQDQCSLKYTKRALDETKTELENTSKRVRDLQHNIDTLTESVADKRQKILYDEGV